MIDKVDLDTKDLVLLRELQDDSSRTNKELGKIVDLAGNTLSDRIRRLRDEEVIKRIGAVISPAKLGLITTAFVLGNFKDGLKQTTAMLEKIAKNSRVVGRAQISEVHTLFGAYDVVFKVRAADNAALQALVDELETKAKITTQTFHVATSVLENDGVIIKVNADK